MCFIFFLNMGNTNRIIKLVKQHCIGVNRGSCYPTFRRQKAVFGCGDNRKIVLAAYFETVFLPTLHNIFHHAKFSICGEYVISNSDFPDFFPHAVCHQNQRFFVKTAAQSASFFTNFVHHTVFTFINNFQVVQGIPIFYYIIPTKSRWYVFSKILRSKYLRNRWRKEEFTPDETRDKIPVSGISFNKFEKSSLL